MSCLGGETTTGRWRGEWGVDTFMYILWGGGGGEGRERMRRAGEGCSFWAWPLSYYHRISYLYYAGTEHDEVS